MLAVISGKKKTIGTDLVEGAKKLGYDVIHWENEKESLDYDALGCDAVGIARYP